VPLPPPPRRPHPVLAPRHLPEEMLVPLAPLPDVALRHQPALHQHLQRAVDRRLADPLAPLPQRSLDLLHRQVLRRREDHLRDGFPLLRDRQALVPQVTPEQMHECHSRASGAGRDSKSTTIIDSETRRPAQPQPAAPPPGAAPDNSASHCDTSPPIRTCCGGAVGSSSLSRRSTPSIRRPMRSAGAMPCSVRSGSTERGPFGSRSTVQRAVKMRRRSPPSSNAETTATTLSARPTRWGGKIQSSSMEGM